MDLALLLYLIVISAIAIPALVYADRQLRRDRSVGDSLITSGYIVTVVAFIVAMNIRLQGQGDFTAYELTWFVWTIINGILTAIFWYATAIHESRQRQKVNPR